MAAAEMEADHADGGAPARRNDAVVLSREGVHLGEDGAGAKAKCASGGQGLVLVPGRHKGLVLKQDCADEEAAGRA